MKGLQKNLFFWLLILMVLVFVFWSSLQPSQETVELNFTDVMTKIKTDEVKSIGVKDNVVGGYLKDDQEFSVYVPEMFSLYYGTEILRAAEEQGIPIETFAPDTEPLWLSILPTLALMGVMLFAWFMLMNSSQGGANKAMSFGKNKAKLHKQEETKKVTFAEVAGLEEEKEEMKEIVDFLKNPGTYKKLGARIPKGVLMSGLPGTGKTYLSRAIAGEANVPFYSISGSDFVEMFVGVGASRVRDLFNTARKDAPCIVFIDEIDAVGRHRGAGLGGGNDEREQTLNQLLVEMDGFGDHEGIIVIAATNRPDILDPALLRPGRFDRQIYVSPPDVKEREAVLKVHSRNKPLAEDVDFKVIAKRTPGFTPADLENMLNEAALITARRKQSVITMDIIEEATTKVIVGVEKKSKVVNDRERRLVSVHEAGHAVVATLLPNTDPVHTVTIVPRGMAGGFTMQLPEEEKNYMTKGQMLSDIMVLLGGRAAEKIVLEDISTGASNDLERVAKVAKDMVVKYAMSDNLSQMSYGGDDNVFIGKDLTTKRDYSEQVISEIDMEIRQIVDRAYDQTLSLLRNNRDKLDAVAMALSEYETIDASEFELVMNQGFEALKALKDAENGLESKEVVDQDVEVVLEN
ncbi:MAG: ATP-dependent zinc metalloprotease FtsH [Tissierellia bacterium]|nr:ATP-dependent zinc metalloprotease FtsH [Tissierellia bacterium]